MQKKQNFTFEDFSRLVLNGEYSLYGTNAIKRSLVKVDEEFVKKELTDKKQLLLFLNRGYETEHVENSSPVYFRFQKNYYLLKSRENEIPLTKVVRLSVASLIYTPSSMSLKPYPNWTN